MEGSTVDGSHQIANDMYKDATLERSKEANGGIQEPIEKHRFFLAMTLIVGLMVLIGIAIMVGEPDAITLSGTFSGWIAAVTGFYFLQQSAERAQQQTRLVYEKVADAGKLGAVTIGNEEFEDFREMFYDVLDSLQADIDERDEMIDDLLEKLEKYVGSNEEDEANEDDGRTA